MTPYKKVLVAIDVFTEYKPVLLRALQVTDKDSEIYLIYVSEPFYFGETLALGSEPIELTGSKEARKVLIEIAEPLDIPENQVFVEIGRPATEIHSKANEIEADLIVMGTHGRHGVQLMLGSTANAVLHGVSCDVLAVRVGGETIDGSLTTQSTDG